MILAEKAYNLTILIIIVQKNLLTPHRRLPSVFGGSGGLAGKAGATDGGGGRGVREVVLEEGKYVQVRYSLLNIIYDL